MYQCNLCDFYVPAFNHFQLFGSYYIRKQAGIISNLPQFIHIMGIDMSDLLPISYIMHDKQVGLWNDHLSNSECMETLERFFPEE